MTPAGTPRKLDRFLLIQALILFVLLAIPPVLGGSTGLWLMQGVPLVLLMPGIHRGRRRSLQWLCFLLLFCFTNGILQLFSPAGPARLLGALTTLSCFVLFTAAILRMRPRFQE